MNILIEEYKETDLKDMITIWNEVVEDGLAFPQDAETQVTRTCLNILFIV